VTNSRQAQILFYGNDCFALSTPFGSISAGAAKPSGPINNQTLLQILAFLWILQHDSFFLSAVFYTTDASSPYFCSPPGKKLSFI